MPKTSLPVAGAALAAMLLLSLAAFWPTLRAHYFLDDYAFVAIARYADHPLSYYFSVHVPAGVFYRPTGMLLWWLTVAADLGPRGQLAANWLLLLGASLLLARLLLAIGLRASVALGASLVFAVHPVAVTTAGWLSNRFDLLATIGLLVAAIGTARWRNEPGSRSALALAGIGTLLAVTAKELGFVTPIAVWALAGGNLRQRSVSPPVLVSALLAAAVFVFRGMLLPGTARVLYPTGVLDALLAGTVAWAKSLPGFLVFLPDHPLRANALFALGVVALAAFVAWSIRARRGDRPWLGAPARAAVELGLAVFGSAALIQSPTASISALAMPTSLAFNGEAFFAARFYYLALAGVLIASAGLASALLGPAGKGAPSASPPATGAPSPRPGGAFMVGAAGVFVAVLVFWGWQSRVQGRLWASASSGITRTIVDEAAAAVARSLASGGNPSPPCRFYLVDTLEASPTFWQYADAMVRARVSPEDARRLGPCLIVTEKTPWYQILRRAGDEAATTPVASPLGPMCLFGQVFPSQAFDTVLIHFLAFPPGGATLRPSAGDRVLRYDGPARKFEDVTERVAAGEVVVRLSFSRPADQACPADRAGKP